MMLQHAAMLKPVMLGMIGLLAFSAGDPNGHRALAAERVQFESARYQAGPLQLRLARERGETVARPPADVIDGYLSKPDGAGPFPAIVHLHGCSGLPAAFKAGTDKGLWSERLAGWGYVVLAVDSFTTRGIAQACPGGHTTADHRHLRRADFPVPACRRLRRARLAVAAILRRCEAHRGDRLFAGSHHGAGGGGPA